MLPDYMPDPQYRSADGLNWSALKHIGKSPKHYQHQLGALYSDSASFRLGRATHAAILEPHRFQSDWVIYPGRRAGKAWQAFHEEHAGREILNETEHRTAQAMAAAVQAHAPCAERLQEGWAERSIFWDEDIPCFAEPVTMKARLDWVYRDGESWVLLDVKTARDISARGFGSAAGRYLYHGQVAHYLTGLQHIVGDAPVRAELLVVETEAPHDCGIYRLDDSAIECGMLRRISLLARLGKCMTEDHWPGMLEQPQWLELPEWELALLDDADVVED